MIPTTIIISTRVNPDGRRLIAAVPERDRRKRTKCGPGCWRPARCRRSARFRRSKTAHMTRDESATPMLHKDETRASAPWFDPALPVNARKDDILQAIAAHPVVVVCGETGSGKTTQLPKMLLEIGRGGAGRIGHTQPRRIAARSVAARIAEELKTELGSLVGYKVRFHDRIGPGCRLKLMTD